MRIDWQENSPYCLYLYGDYPGENLVLRLNLIIYQILSAYLYVLLFFFLGEISYTGTLVNPRWNKGDAMWIVKDVLPILS